MNADDRVRLRHMLEAGLEARAFAKDRTLEDLSSNRMFLLSLVKEIEIIGECRHIGQRRIARQDA